MKKKIVIISLLSLSLNANSISLPIPKSSCLIPDEIMTALAMTEGTQQKKVGYEYLIRINGKDNSLKAKKKLNALIENKKITQLSQDKYGDVYDCKNERQCIETTNQLIDAEITNLDLGAYQTNYKYHTSDIEHYFNFNTSYMLACRYQHQLVNQYGWSWQTVAKYHSKTKEHNERYQKILIANYKKVIGVKN
ncbi:MAG: hypothetical protein PHE67_03775 [Campylobacterales bacterium]|nr:hypothetical protein [Campylobacterales bacterium]